MLHAREALIEKFPIKVEREVLWGECDPAGFVYTPRFGDYVAGAAQYFSSHILGPIIDPASRTRIGIPMKALSFVFSSFLRPLDRFTMCVNLGDIGRTTFELLITAEKGSRLVFEASMRRICFDSEALKAVPLPDPTRVILENYKKECLRRAT